MRALACFVVGLFLCGCASVPIVPPTLLVVNESPDTKTVYDRAGVFVRVAPNSQKCVELRFVDGLQVLGVATSYQRRGTWVWSPYFYPETWPGWTWVVKGDWMTDQLSLKATEGCRVR
jgi:hypothetical protein